MRGRSDIVVVGAGPAGSAAAITALAGGARVALVDRARFPRAKTCGDALSNGALSIVRELGAELATIPHAPVERAAAVFPDGHRVVRSYGSELGAIATRRDFDDLLCRRAQQAGADVIEGVAVRSVERGRILGDGFEWHADVVIAADGPASIAWSALGRRAPRGRGLALAATAYLRDVTLDDPATSEHYFEPELRSGYAWVFPAVDGICNVGVYQRADRYRQQSLHLFELLDAFIRRHPERFAKARRVGRVRSWPLPLATARPFCGAPGVFACGDAARLVDPLTGEGIWHALHSGRLAARAALGALGERGADRAALARYALSCSLEVGWPTAARRTLQAGVDAIVARGLYTLPTVQRALAWGYGENALEISKSVAKR